VKYTVLQLRYGLWLPIREYYQFPVRQCKQQTGTGGTKARFECPGCLESFTELYILDHQCQGGSADYPRLDILKYKTNQRWRPTSTFDPVRLRNDVVGQR